MGQGFARRHQERYYQRMQRRMSHRLGGPVAPVLGVIRGSAAPAHGANPGRLVVLTERNLYLMKGGKMFASAPGQTLLKEPIESVSLSFDPAPSHTTLTIGDHAIRFYFQRGRAVEMMDAVATAQGNATPPSTSRRS